MTRMLIRRRTAEIPVTREHLQEGYEAGVHPIALAIDDAMPGFGHVEIMLRGALCWTGEDVTTLRFSALSAEYITACDIRMQREPFTLTAEVSS